jgi:hypothetical protein
MKSIYSFPTMLLTTVMILTMIMLSACAETRPAPGKYETTTKSVDADGTVHQSNNSTNIYYDKNGKMHGSVDKTTTTDPKGLLNKSTTETHKTIQ